MGIIISRGDRGGGGGYTSYYYVEEAGATPAGVFVKDNPRIIPYLGFNNGSYHRSDTAELPPIPLEWVIAPLNVSAGQCPTAEQTKLAFGITNLVVGVLTLVFGCRPILHYLSRGWLGKKGGKGVAWTWIISFALQLLSNLFASLMVVHTPGFEHLSMLNTFALYAARPRINVVWTACLRMVVAVNLHAWSEKADRGEEFVFADSYISAATSELFLQIVAASFTGLTWSRFPNTIIRDYASANWKTMCAMPGFVLLGWLFVPIWRRVGESIEFASYYNQGTGWRLVWGRRLIRGLLMMACSIPYWVMYMLIWGYWNMFLQLPGSLCVSPWPLNGGDHSC